MRGAWLDPKLFNKGIHLTHVFELEGEDLWLWCCEVIIVVVIAQNVVGDVEIALGVLKGPIIEVATIPNDNRCVVCGVASMGC